MLGSGSSVVIRNGMACTFRLPNSIVSRGNESTNIVFGLFSTNSRDRAFLAGNHIESAQYVEEGKIVVCARGDLDPHSLIVGSNSGFLVEGERLVQASLTLGQIHHRAKRQKRFGIDIRIDLISGDEESRGRGRSLRSDREKQSVAVEITLAPAHLKTRGTKRCIAVADEHLIVELFAEFEWQVCTQRRRRRRRRCRSRRGNNRWSRSSCFRRWLNKL